MHKIPRKGRLIFREIYLLRTTTLTPLKTSVLRDVGVFEQNQIKENSDNVMK